MPIKTHMMAEKVIGNIVKVESTKFANRLMVSVRKRESKDDSKFFGLRTSQKALSFTEMRKIQEHLERRMGESRVLGEWWLVTLPG